MISSDTLIRFRELLVLHKNDSATEKQVEELKELKERFMFEEPGMYRNEIDTYGKPESHPGSVD